MMRHALNLSLLALFILTTSACASDDSLTVEVVPSSAAAELAPEAKATVSLWERDLSAAGPAADGVFTEAVFILDAEQRAALLAGEAFEFELDGVSRSEEFSYNLTVRIDVDDDGEDECPDYYEPGIQTVEWDAERAVVQIASCPDE